MSHHPVIAEVDLMGADCAIKSNHQEFNLFGGEMFLSAVKDIRYKRSFGAKGLESGTRTVDEFVTIIDISDRLDPHAEIEGLHQLRTREGQSVNALGDGRFKILQTGEILVATNPDVAEHSGS